MPETAGAAHRPRNKVLTLFGTRPEVIKLAPVLHELERYHSFISTINVSSGQHTNLLYPFIKTFGIRVDRDLKAMRAGQPPGELCQRILQKLNRVLNQVRPTLVLVQGDTTTALAGALAGAQQGVPVAHVEAGLRSGNLSSPYPEEINRMLITRLAAYHFAATSSNRDLLLSEGISPGNVFLTGNPIVAALRLILRDVRKSPRMESLLQKTVGRKCIVLTTHRRESFEGALANNLRALSTFVAEHNDVVLVFPVHPNPNVKLSANKICSGQPRIILTEPLEYRDFIELLSNAWLIISDSGGVQEEAPSLGKPVLILRENTERTECIEAGIARLVGCNSENLSLMLEEAYRQGSWVDSVTKIQNPFGDADSGRRIAAHVAALLGVQGPARRRQRLQKSQLHMRTLVGVSMEMSSVLQCRRLLTS